MRRCLAPRHDAHDGTPHDAVGRLPLLGEETRQRQGVGPTLTARAGVDAGAVAVEILGFPRGKQQKIWGEYRKMMEHECI